MKTLRIKRLNKKKSKKYFYTLIFVLVATLNINAQKLSLEDLQIILNKSNWEEVNQYLLNKNWKFFSLKTKVVTQYKTITWSYNKSHSETPEAWLLVYTNNAYPHKIDYSVFNKQSFSIIEKSLDAKGYKQDSSFVQDDEQISTYSNNEFTIKITTERNENNSDYLNNIDDSTAYYHFSFYQKINIYDQNNGKKTTYHVVDDLIIKSEYTLINGKIEGEQIKYYYGKIERESINYYPDGRVKKRGNYQNGIANGNFKEYDSYGNLSSEYFMENGKVNGIVKEFYQNGQLKAEANFIEDKQDGTVIEYLENGWVKAKYTFKDNMLNGIYLSFVENKKDEEKGFLNGTLSGKYKKYIYNDNGDLFQIYKGNYIDGKQNGEWKLEEIEPEGEVRILSSINYSGGLKNGRFQRVELDRLIIGSYLSDKLDGKLMIYVDSTQMRLKSISSLDTAKMSLIGTEYYNNGLQTGEWKYYDVKGSLIYSEKY